MRVISRCALREFWEVHTASKDSLAAWFRLMERSDLGDFNATKRAFGTADYVAPYTVFNVGGNNYRVITVVHYDRRRVYVRHVFTRAEYDRWSDRTRRTKRDKR